MFLLELWIELKREGDFPNLIRGGRNCFMLVVSKAWRLETGASHFIMIHQLESTALAKRTHRLSWPSNTPTKISSAQITNTRYVHHTLARRTHCTGYLLVQDLDLDSIGFCSSFGFLPLHNMHFVPIRSSSSENHLQHNFLPIYNFPIRSVNQSTMN